MSRNSTKISKSLVLKPQATPPSVPENNEIYNDSSDGLRRWDALTSTWSPIGSGAGEGINFLSNGKADLGLLGWVNYSDALPNTNTDVVGDTVDVQLNNDLSSVDSKGNLKSQARLRYVGSTPNGGMSLDTDYYAVPPVLGKGNQNPWTFGVSSTISGSAENISSNAGQGNSRFLPYVPVSGGNGTFGTTSLDFSINTVDPLSGTQDFKLSKGAGSALGQGMSADFSIDRARLGKTIQISFDYKNSSAFATGDLTVYIYDRTNNVIIEPVGSSILAHGLPSMSHVASFQTAINSLDYRLIFHVASTNASAWDFEFDNVVVGPEIASAVTGNKGARLCTSVSQTGINPNGTYVKLNLPTLSYDEAGLADATNSRLYARETGKYWLSACYTIGSANVLNNRYLLGARLNGTATVIALSDSVYPSSGTAFNCSFATEVELTAGDYVELYLFGQGNNSTNTLSGGNSTTAHYMTLRKVDVPVPTKAYSTNAPAVFSVTAGTPTGTLAQSFNNVNFGTANVFNTHGFPWDGTSLTVTKPGWYQASACLEITATWGTTSNAFRTGLDIRLNGTGTYGSSAELNYFSATTYSCPNVVSIPFYCKAGDIVTVRSWCGGGTPSYTSAFSGSRFSLHEVPAPVTSIAPGKMKKYQIKTLASNISGAGSGSISGLSFSNLTIGKNYRVTISLNAVAVNDSDNIQLYAQNNSNYVCRQMAVVSNAGPSDRQIQTGSGNIFTATATSLAVSYQIQGGAGIIEGNGTTVQTWVMLEECDDMIPTTDWN